MSDIQDQAPSDTNQVAATSPATVDDADFKFACSACGKCCSQGPTLTIREAFYFAEHFVSGLYFKSHLFANFSDQRPGAMPAGWDMASLAQLQQHCDNSMTYIEDPNGVRHYIAITPKVTGYSLVQGRCDSLTGEGQCSIYEQRPVVCRATPMQASFPVALQGRSLQSFEAIGCASREASDERPIIFSRGKIVDAAYEQQLTELQNEVHFDSAHLGYLLHLMFQGHPITPNVQAVMETSGNGMWVETSFVPALFMLASHNRDNEGMIREFIRKQTILINSEIDRAVQRKIADERGRTQTLRNYLADYARFLVDLDHPQFPWGAIAQQQEQQMQAAAAAAASQAGEQGEPAGVQPGSDAASPAPMQAANDDTASGNPPPMAA